MELTLRRGTTSDAEPLAELYLRAHKAAIPVIPMTAHTDEEVRDWIAELVIPRREVWVAEGDELVASWCSTTTGSISSMSSPN